MRLISTPISGVILVEADPVVDERGLFARIYDEDLFREAGLPTSWPQSNVSWNPRLGTLRGMHYQTGPHAESKLVRCIRGRIFDVAIDLRETSGSFLQWWGVELSANARNAVYIPEGCAHGFLTLEAETEVHYMMSARYQAASGAGVRWNDPAFSIHWPAAPTLIGLRDAGYPDYKAV